MNGISNADFVNSAAAGKAVQCQFCGAQNQYGNKFCIKCGHALIYASPRSAPPAAAAKPEKKAEPSTPFAAAKPEKKTEPGTPFAAAKPEKKTEPGTPFAAAKPEKKAKPGTPFAAAKPEKKTAFETFEEVLKEHEEVSVFAQGLPEWDLEPPQIMVRRKRKK